MYALDRKQTCSHATFKSSIYCYCSLLEDEESVNIMFFVAYVIFPSNMQLLFNIPVASKTSSSAGSSNS